MEREAMQETALASSLESEDSEEKRRGWYGNSEGHAMAGRLGGASVARDRAYMAEIGRRGGKKVAQNREHMAEIGRRGGKNKPKRAA